MVLAIANDRQFKNFCNFSNLKSLPSNPKFKNNYSRVKNRIELNKIIEKILKKKNHKRMGFRTNRGQCSVWSN